MHIRRKEVFEYLDIEVECVWQQLLWMDPFNYGGIKAVEDGSAPVEMNWNIVEYLPQPLQKVGPPYIFGIGSELKHLVFLLWDGPTRFLWE